MLNTHELRTTGGEPYLVWRLDILDSDIIKAQRIRQLKIRTEPEKASHWLPTSAPSRAMNTLRPQSNGPAASPACASITPI